MIGKRVVAGGYPRFPVVDSIYAAWDFSRDDMTTTPSDPSVNIATIGAQRTSPSNVVTIATSTNHGLNVNDVIALSGLNASAAAANANGIWTVATVPTANAFTYVSANTNTFLDGDGKVSLIRGFRKTFLDISGHGRHLGIAGAGTGMYPGATPLNFRKDLHTNAGGSPSGLNHPNGLADNGSFGTLAQPFSITFLFDITSAGVEAFLTAQNNAVFMGGFLGLGLINAGANYAPLSYGAAGKKVFTGIFNGASSKIYVDGAQIGVTGNAGTNSLTSVFLGNNTFGSNPVNALIDSVYIHSKEVTAAEALQIYQYGRRKMGY